VSFSSDFLDKCSLVISKIDAEAVEKAAHFLTKIRDAGGRLFVIGSGGGAGHASHATCDFRKLCSIEAYAPYDNVSELTARVNDDGWDSTLVNWLKISKLNNKDGLFVFSVGGGDAQKNVSSNLVNAITFAKEHHATVIGVVGKDGGHVGRVADVSIIIPNVFPELVTPMTEGLQSVAWHLLVSHPSLQTQSAKWEGLAANAK
jgi:D-sedoheptulose 7-phosphate isomerase